jgi:hypothetical protein
MIIRGTFPQVYKLKHTKGEPYFLVSARSAKWGLNERKIFPTQTLAERHAKEIEKQLLKFGSQTQIPKEKVLMADRLQELTSQLAHFGKSPEDD